jgi:hypothetical protein
VSWFDMSGGWFSHPDILSAMRRAHQVAEEDLAVRTAFKPQVGVFVDPESFYWMRSTDANRRLVLNQLTLMPQAGAPFDYCLLSDIDQPWLPDYRLYVFLNAFHVDSALRKAIHAKLQRNHATALFIYAPGYFGSGDDPLQGMQALTGIRIAMDDAEGKPQLSLDPNDPLSQGLDAGKPAGADATAAPVFYADDPAARVAARLAGGDRAALVVKDADGWTAIYSSAMELPPGLMRNIARAAGVHIWLDTDDAIYTDGEYVGIHAASDGRKSIHLPVAANAVDVISGQSVPSDARSVNVDMKRAQTVMLRLRPRG